MTIYINGEQVSSKEAFSYFVGRNFSCDIVELKAVFEKALTAKGEDQRDLLLNDGIEIVLN